MILNGVPSHEMLKLSQGRRRDAGEAQLAIIADNPNVPGNRNLCYVRFFAGTDTSGIQQYSPPVAVRQGIGANFIKKGGRRVWVGRGYDGLPEIKSGDWQDLVQVGIVPSVTNALTQEGKATNPANPFIPLTAEPVNTANTPGMLVTVYPLWYDTGTAIKFYAGTEATGDKVDLTSFVPSAGEWCYVLLWLDTATNALETPTASTPVTITSTSPNNTSRIDAIEECYAARPNADCIPVKAFYLADAQTTLRQSAKHIDFRQMVNMPSSGTSLPVVDTTAIVKGSADATKLLRFEVDGFTTATTRVLTPPNYDGTIATLAGTETFTNKTLTSPTVNSPTISGGTIDNTPIGTTTRALGYFSALRLYIGGFAAMLTHAFTADRTVTLPGDADVTLVGVATTQTLTGKTITSGKYNELLDTNGNEEIKFTATASAVNELTIANAATGTNPKISVSGDDTHVGLELIPKGNGAVISAATVRSDTDIADDLGVSAAKWLNTFTQRVVFEETSPPSTPASGDYVAYVKAIGSFAALFGKDDAGTEIQITPMMAIVSDDKSSTTAGGTSTSSTWNARDVNTEISDPYGLVTLSSNKMVFAVGDYIFLSVAPVFGATGGNSNCQGRLWNVTAGSQAILGGSQTASVSSAAYIVVLGRFTSNGSDEYRVDTYTSAGRTTNGLGVATGSGSGERYTINLVIKVS